MNEKMLPLLSDGLKKIIENVNNKHFCGITRDLLEADNLTISYNDLNQVVEFNPHYNSLIELIVPKINKLINEEARMLSFRHDVFEISYLPKGKEAKYSSDGIWSRENRQTAKPARIIQKLLVTEYKCKEYEDFSNWIKAEMLNAGEFKLVEGSDITKYYLDEYYYSLDGTLGNSCMRHEECQEYFGIYEDHAKMLVCFKEGKVLGRAIIWEIDNKIFMDRIYTCMDYLEGQFIDFAKSNNWYIRKNNSLLSDGEFQEWLGPESNYTNPKKYDLTIKLSKTYEYMPYVDSFRYYNEESNTIHTNPMEGDIELSNTDGSYGKGYREEYVCCVCGSTEICYNGDAPSDLIYSEYEDDYYCENCCTYCDGIDDYVSINRETIRVKCGSDNYMKFPLDYVQDSDDYANIEGVWYEIDSCNCIYDEEQNKYIIKDE